MNCPFCNFQLRDENYIGMTRCPSCSRAFSVFYAIGKKQLNSGFYNEAINNFYKAKKYFKNTCLLHLDFARAYKHVGNEEGYSYSINRAMEIDEEVYYEYVREWDLL